MCIINTYSLTLNIFEHFILLLIASFLPGLTRLVLSLASLIEISMVLATSFTLTLTIA